MAALMDHLLPLLQAVIRPQERYVGPMGTDLVGRDIIELKYVLNHLLLIRIDGSLLAAGVHHHADLLLCHLLFILIRIHAQQPQNPVGGNRQQPYQWRKDHGYAIQHFGHAECQLFRVLHSKTFGNQLSKY